MSDFVPPVPPTVSRKASLLRRFFDIRRSSISILYERSYKMKMGKVRLPFRTVYFVNEPSLVRRVLVEDYRRFPKSDLLGAMLQSVTGEGIFTTNGPQWERQRRMMSPAFEQARLQDVFPLMLDAVDDLLRRLEPLAGGPAFAADLETTHVTADIIYRTIFSEPLTEQAAHHIFHAFKDFQERAYSFGMLQLGGVPAFLYHRSRRKAAESGRQIRHYLEVPVRERLAAPPAEGGRRDILASLIAAVDPETGSRFTERELVDQIAVLFLAGHETSASVLAWALWLLAMRPEVQERAAAEAQAALGERRPAFADMRRLPFVRDVFREALRLYPPVSYIARDVTQPETMRDKKLKKGDVLMISPWLIQRHRDIWERADAFDPARWQAGSEEAQRKGYLPFSLGPRVCVGASFALQEATLILACLLRRFRLLPEPSQVPVPVARLTLRSETGVHLRIERR